MPSARKSAAPESPSPPRARDQLWSINQVAEYVGVDVSTIRRWTEAGAFPKPRKCNGWAVRWHSKDVVAWWESQPVVG